VRRSAGRALDLLAHARNLRVVNVAASVLHLRDAGVLPTLV